MMLDARAVVDSVWLEFWRNLFVTHRDTDCRRFVLRPCNDAVRSWRRNNSLEHRTLCTTVMRILPIHDADLSCCSAALYDVVV
jgi:hypothetical protein